MVSLEVHGTPKLAARMLMLAAAAIPFAGFPQPTRLGDDAVQPIFDRIEEERAQNGSNSASLLGPLTALSFRYQESGDHVLAAAVIEQALQVARVNYGLYSFEQIPLLRRSIDNETARGNIAGAWELEQKLLTLLRRHPNDLRIVHILREIGDDRTEVLERYVAGEFPPQVMLGCYLEADVGSCRSGSKGVAVRAIRRDAQRKYTAAIRVMLRHGLYSSDELRELEMELVRSSYVDGNYELGRQRLRALLSYQVASSEPWLSRLNAFLQITDWDLLFGNNGLAFDVYQEAYEELKRQGVVQASIEQIFAPEVPIVLPAFLPNPLASEQTPLSTGFIDVAFEVTKYGAARRIEILETTTNATHAAKRALAQLISRSRFRPRLTDDRIATSPVVVRYYLNDSHDLDRQPDPRAPQTRTSGLRRVRAGNEALHGALAEAVLVETARGLAAGE